MKIGIVGTGNISTRHFSEFNSMQNVSIEAVCDTNEKNLNKFLSNINNTNINVKSSKILHRGLSET